MAEFFVPAVDDGRAVGRGAAHVESDEVVQVELLGHVLGRDDASGRAGASPRQAARLARAFAAPTGQEAELHDAIEADTLVLVRDSEAMRAAGQPADWGSRIEGSRRTRSMR